jgi:Tol biopolymer transport system component
LNKNPAFRNIIASTWSPDGTDILARIERVDRTAHQIAWISSRDGSTRVIKSVEWGRHPGFHMSLSPDGRYIAYATRSAEGAKDVGAIYLLTADGSREIELIKTASINDHPVWSSDGKRVLFMSNRSGTFDLWSLAVDNGKPRGVPTIVKTDIGKISPVSLGLMSNGTYYFMRRQSGVEHISVVAMVPGGARIDGSTPRVIEKLTGAGPTWSPDGRFIAFSKFRTALRDSFDRVLHSMDTGEEKIFTRPGFVNGPARWLHNSSGFLETLQDENGVRALHRVDVKTGELKQLFSFGSSPTTGHIGILSPDDKVLYVMGRDGGRSDHIVAFEIATGRRSTVFSLQGGGDISAFKLSPDGRSLALRIHDEAAKEARIARVDANGSNYQELHKASFAESPRRPGFSWTRDSKGILFLALGKTAGELRIMRLPTDGGSPEFTGVEAQGLIYFDLNADGTRIAYSHQDENATELWALDNVLAAFKDSK